MSKTILNTAFSSQNKSTKTNLNQTGINQITSYQYAADFK
jgi:hypothetical protein